jgi:hypothetical protein
LVVEPSAKATERWWILLCGVFVLLEGTKIAVRWTLWHPPMPFMGLELGAVASGAVSVLFGCALCVTGLFVLRCDQRGAVLGTLLYIVVLISGVLSYEFWPSWVAQDVEARRAMQGVPVGEDEVQIMQRFIPLVFVGSPILMMAWLAFIARTLGIATNGPRPPMAAEASAPRG